MKFLRRAFFAAFLALLPLADAFPQTPVAFNRSVVVNSTGSGDQTIIAGVTGKRIFVYGWTLTSTTVTTWTWKSGSTALTGPTQTNAWSQQITTNPAYFVTNVGDSLIINLGASTTIAGVLWYAVQ